MVKNIMNWFAVLVFAGVLSACGQNGGSEQGADKGATGAPEQSTAPAGGEKPTEPGK